MSTGPPAPSRSAISRILRETGELLELRGENPFRARAYSNGARALEGLIQDPQELYEAGTLAEVQGVGPGLVNGIAEILQTGKLALHDTLRADSPAGVLELLRIPGLGPKRLRILLDALQIGSVEELERACHDGRVAGLSGFGAKSQEKLLASLVSRARHAERRLLPDALEQAEQLRAEIARDPAVVRVEIAGSARRRLETVGDVSILVSLSSPVDPASVRVFFDRLLAGRSNLEVVERSDERLLATLPGGLRATVRWTAENRFEGAWLWETGSRAHLAALIERARSRGLELTEVGLVDPRDPHGSLAQTEAAIYAHLDLAWIPPEAREGLREIEAADSARQSGQVTLPDPIRVVDLRGTFHVHTTWSDGIASVDEMADAAAGLGWDYLGIADHSKAAAYAGGLDRERVLRQWAEIDARNALGRGPRLFKGTECDVLADGTLDFDDELLAGFDFVVASIHSRFALSREAMTARLVRAVSHPRVTFLGHPTGRLLLMRDAYALDLDAVLDAAAANGVIVEVNANAHRLDLDWRQLASWLDRGLPTSIHPDAHTPRGLEDVRWGVDIARKALTPARQVFNSWSLEEVERYLRDRRARAEALGA